MTQGFEGHQEDIGISQSGGRPLEGFQQLHGNIHV